MKNIYEKEKIIFSLSVFKNQAEARRQWKEKYI
jgi:hypothetical protein